MTAPGSRRNRCRVVGLIAVLVLGVTLAACSNNGLSLAKQACGHINRSFSLLERAKHGSDPSEVSDLQQQAYDQLRDALPIAAQAANHDGQWQALMTTIAESNRVPESTLTTALAAQCQEADSSAFGEPAPPTSIPPPAPVQSSP